MKKKIQKFTTIEEALASSSDEEKQSHRDAREYNEKDYLETIKGCSRNSASWLVIDGEIYYLYEIDGRKMLRGHLIKQSGLKLLNRLDVSCTVLHDGSFYRVIIKGEELTLERNEFGEVIRYRRDTQSREAYAQRGWTMTTESQLKEGK